MTHRLKKQAADGRYLYGLEQVELVQLVVSMHCSSKEKDMGVQFAKNQTFSSYP